MKLGLALLSNLGIVSLFTTSVYLLTFSYICLCIMYITKNIPMVLPEFPKHNSRQMVKGHLSYDRTQITTLYLFIYLYISRISPLVDDLSLTIYPPLVWEEAKEAAWKLKQTLEVRVIKLFHVFYQQKNPIYLIIVQIHCL